MDHSTEVARLLMTDWEENLRRTVGTEPWLVIYDFGSVLVESATYWCGLIPEEHVPQALGHVSWDVRWGDGCPGNSVCGDVVEYHRIGSQRCAEPLVIVRNFEGCAPKYLEIAEDFRLFHNLYHDTERRKFYRFDEDGNPEDVIVFEGNTIKAKLKPLKQYLAIRDMRLAIFVEFYRFSTFTLAELGLEGFGRKVREDGLTYDVYVYPKDFDDKAFKSGCKLIGKKLIKGMPKEKSGIWPYDQEEAYEDFIIGTDEHGEPVSNTCDPDRLSNYFGANPGAPHYLTPVFFRKEVLTRYYNQPDKFSIEDGCLRCRSRWLLNIDNDHHDYVMVYLGDLGRDLTPNERRYWRSFNIPPDGTQKMSETAFRRDFLAEWADPAKADLIFKSRLGVFRDRFAERFGWHLFKPLSEEDAHNLTALRIPVTDEQAEFDAQVLSLTKILPESINNTELDNVLADKVPDERSIAKLERYLSTQGHTGYEPHIQFLRNLQKLRSISTGHRKGSDFAKVGAKLGLGSKRLSELFVEYLEGAIALIEYLMATFELQEA